ncbi:MAG: class I SAM-dependent methyltransferase [Lachnospiraceae bacterium]|nr:class I SAM-dependent methyltransferase [Lachnospiraceae bacterium]
MQLSRRLLAVAGMVTPGYVLADIGTDHAYIPIYLIENKRISHAIAADINEGPLARAKAHIQEHGLEYRIETRLSDGLSAFLPGEAQSIVLAGMGGALTIRILQDGMERLESAELPELILQPQSEISQVRAYLQDSGWSIVQEDMVFEDGKYYPMMKVKRCEDMETPPRIARRQGGSSMEVRIAKDEPMETPPRIARRQDGSISSMSDLQLAFGPELLKMRHPVLHQFLLHDRRTQERILESLGLSQKESAAVRAEEIRDRIRLIDQALSIYSGEAANQRNVLAQISD